MVRLTQIVSQDNVEGLRNYITTLKRENSKWVYKPEISNLCREAIEIGYDHVVQIFLDEGVDPSTYASVDGSKGLFSLEYFAAKVGRLSTVKMLVECKSNYREEKNHVIALKEAIERGHSSIVQYYLERGLSPEGQLGTYFQPRTYLGAAAFNGNKAIVEVLVKKGASIARSLESNYECFEGLKRRNDQKVSAHWHLPSVQEKIKNELDEKFKGDLKKYSNSVQMLLDEAFGANLESRESYKALSFLKPLDISGFNFVGVSIDEEPVTRQRLLKEKINGAQNALMTPEEIQKISDSKRREELLSKLAEKIRSMGYLASNGIINLVPLAVTAKNGLDEVVKVRLESGMNPNQQTSSFPSEWAIVAAAKNNHFSVVKRLIEHSNIDKTVLRSARDAARNNHHMKMVDFINDHLDVDLLDQEGEAPIHRAISDMNKVEVERLLEKGAKIDLENERGRTPLALAAALGDRGIDLIQLLLAYQADPNRGKESPLEEAFKAGSYRAVKILLPITEKIDLLSNGNVIPWYVYPLHYSFNSEEWLLIATLLKQNYQMDLNSTYPRHIENTLLHLVMRNLGESLPTLERLSQEVDPKSFDQCEKRVADLLRRLDFLLENGNHPATVDHNNRTPLHELLRYKINFGFFEKKGMLEKVIGKQLQHGLKINAQDCFGNTFLHLAACISDLKCAAYLIEKEANVNAQNINGMTPLHFATIRNPEMVKLLIQSKADVLIANNEGLSPLEYSRMIGTGSNPFQEDRRHYLKSEAILEEALKALNLKE